MAEKFLNKYRIPSARLQTWDYGSNAAYFVTICTKDRVHFFGEMVNREMQLSGIGAMAQTCWGEIPKHFPFVELGGFVVMPNHVHGIVIINKRDGDGDGGDVKTQNIASLRERQKIPECLKFFKESICQKMNYPK